MGTPFDVAVVDVESKGPEERNSLPISTGKRTVIRRSMKIRFQASITAIKRLRLGPVRSDHNHAPTVSQSYIQMITQPVY